MDEKDLYRGFEWIEMVGEKVRLRPPRSADARAAYELVKNPNVLATLSWDGPASAAELKKTYSRWAREMKNGQNHNLTIEPAGRPELIGNIGVRFPRHPLQADIGYWLGEPYWNGGLMTEALRLICHFAFKYLDSVRAYATVFVGNTGSRRVLEKNGFSLEGTLRCHVYKGGKWLDCWFFSLLRDEWESRRGEYTPRQEDIRAGD